MGRGIIESGLFRSERYQFKERTSDPTTTYEGDAWIRTDLAPNTDQLATLRFDNGASNIDIPIFDASATADGVEKAWRVQVGGVTGFIPITTSSPTYNQLKYQHAGTTYGAHDALAASAIPDSVGNHWPMDEGSGSTLADNVGSRNLSLTGGSWTGDVLVLNGSSDYAANGDSYFDALDDFSLFGWFKTDSDAVGALAGSYDTNGNRSWWTGVGNDLINVNTSNDGVNFQRHEFDTPLSSETWTSFALARTASSGSVEIWKNAGSLGTATLDSGTLYDNNLGLFVGQRGDGTNFGGNLRAYAFAKDHVWADSEVQTLHDSTDPR